MKMLVQLVGSQPLPNVLTALYLQPNSTLLVYTPQTDAVRRRIESVVGPCQLICCDAYDIEGLVKQLQDVIVHYSESELVFNLTGGTKAMVLAANQVALQRNAQIVYLESEHNQNVLYAYRYDDQRSLRLQSRIELPALISIDQFLDAHLGRGQWEEKGPSRDIGGQFEQAVADALRVKLPQAEIKQGVRFLGRPDGTHKQGDLDIVVRCGNQFACIECKSQGKTMTLDAAKQLNMWTEPLGTYTHKFIAMSDSYNPEHEDVYEIIRAKVIVLSSFSNGQSLSEEDQERLAKEIAKALGCSKYIDA
jgi:hypothetical protein